MQKGRLKKGKSCECSKKTEIGALVKKSDLFYLNIYSLTSSLHYDPLKSFLILGKACFF